MRVIVTGDRHGYAPELAEGVLNRLLAKYGPGLVTVHGAAIVIGVSLNATARHPRERVSRRKEGQAQRVSFAAEDVFHGFIAAAPVKIRSGPLQPRLEWGGRL